nr:MAG TPA: hypothetical protein [Bacteriophage sp.]
MVWSDRVRFPVPLFIYAKLCVSMIKHCGIFISNKRHGISRGFRFLL